MAVADQDGFDGVFIEGHPVAVGELLEGVGDQLKQSVGIVVFSHFDHGILYPQLGGALLSLPSDVVAQVVVVQLFDHLIGDRQLGDAQLVATDGQQPRLVEQTEEIHIDESLLEAELRSDRTANLAGCQQLLSQLEVARFLAAQTEKLPDAPVVRGDVGVEHILGIVTMSLVGFA